MTLVLVGVNFNDIPLAELETLERHTDAIRQSLTDSDSEIGIKGSVVIGTCNRFEIYLDTERFHEPVNHAIRVIAEATGWNADYCSENLRVIYGLPAVSHLFSVASGLESMVVGEAEISGQVKDALRVAQRNSQTTKTLEQLFQRAARVSKQIVSKTGIGSAGRSIISVALELAETRHGKLDGKSALVLGTGAYARVVVAALNRLGIQGIAVYSTSGRALRFSITHSTRAVKVEDLAAEIAEADIVIAASGAKNHLVDKQLIEASGILNLRTSQNPLPIIDVALSADVAVEVAELNEVDLINLEVIREHVPSEQTEAVLKAQQAVALAVNEYEQSLKVQDAEPAVVALRDHVALAVSEEVERVRQKAGDQAAEEVARSLQRLANTILHAPSVRAKEIASTGSVDDYRKAVHLLFGIDLDAQSSRKSDD